LAAATSFLVGFPPWLLAAADTGGVREIRETRDVQLNLFPDLVNILFWSMDGNKTYRH
jgi:hypothetical protein